ncbi:MAG: nucleotide-binding protein, partial [Polyangiaceae bacterium]
ASPTDIDMFVGRFDLLGQHAWSISNGGLGNDDDASGVSDGALGVFVAGRFGSTVDIDGSVLTSAGAEDALVLGLDQGGGLEWGVRAGDAGEQEATVIAQSTTAVVVGGAFTSGIELGDGATLSSNGGRDVFVALLAP